MQCEPVPLKRDVALSDTFYVSSAIVVTTGLNCSSHRANRFCAHRIALKTQPVPHHLAFQRYEQFFFSVYVIFLLLSVYVQ